MATKRSAADAPGDCERLSKKAAVQSSATATQVPSSSGEWKLAPTGTLSSIDRAGAARAPSLRPTNAPRNGAAVPHAPHAAAAQTAATSSAAPTAAKSSVTPTATTLPAATLFATPTVTTLTAATPTVTTLTVVPTAGLFGASSTAAATVLASSSSTATMSASSSSTASLPQSHPIVKGLYYIPNYITETEHEQMVAELKARAWSKDLSRRTQQYGYKYSYKTKGLAKLPASQKFPSTCQGIEKHVDRVDCFGACVASLSLGQECVVDMYHHGTKQSVAMAVAPRSLYIMTGDARYTWQHGIASKKIHVADGRAIHRVAARISVTYRAVLATGRTRA